MNPNRFTQQRLVDVPSFARELAVLALALRGEEAPPLWQEDMHRHGVRFDFALPGSTHGFRSSGSNKLPLKAAKGALEIGIDRLERGESGRVFWKPFYRRHDFDDERYRPMFSPLAASGQEVEMVLRFEPWEGDGNLRIAPYVRLSHSQKIVHLGAFNVPSHVEDPLRFVLPHSEEPFDEIGIEIEYFGRLKCLGRLFVSHFEIKGAGQTVIDPAQETLEWGAISRFTWNRGHWSLQDGQIHGHTAEDADLWTGQYYARDLTFTVEVTPLAGPSHLVSARVQGACRFYAGGFEGESLVLLKEDFGTTVLAKVPFARRLGQSYSLALRVSGDLLELSVDGELRLRAQDTSFAYGMCGLRMACAGRMQVGRLTVQEEASHGAD